MFHGWHPLQKLEQIRGGGQVILHYHKNNHLLYHNIIHIHINIMWDWHYSIEYSNMQAECEEYSMDILPVP